jgi:hypothetical protein
VEEVAMTTVSLGLRTLGVVSGVCRIEGFKQRKEIIRLRSDPRRAPIAVQGVLGQSVHRSYLRTSRFGAIRTTQPEKADPLTLGG